MFTLILILSTFGGHGTHASNSASMEKIEGYRTFRECFESGQQMQSHDTRITFRCLQVK